MSALHQSGIHLFGKMKIKLSEFNHDFLKLSFIWLNDPEIKELTNTPVFTKESQLSWFESLKERKDYLVWGIMSGATPVGVCGLKKITLVDCEYWGYIGEKSYWGKGIGKTIMNLMEAEARKLNLKSIWLQVIADNERAVKLYLKAGYLIEKKEQDFFYMRKEL